MLITAIYKARFPLLRKGSKTLGRSRPLRTNVALRYLGALFCAISLHRCRTVDAPSLWR